LKKNINQIAFNFAEEGPGRGSEDIKTECDVSCFDIFFFSVFFFNGSHGWKNHNQLKRTALKLKKKKHMQNGKELEAR